MAGVIDGDGYLGLSKKGYASLEIVMEVRDIACLIKIKNIYGGSVKATSHAQAMRYRLHHKDGIISLLSDMNGLLLNPVRIAQFEKLAKVYNIVPRPSQELDFNSRYIAGLFDSDGSVYVNLVSNQVFVTISQKSRTLLDIVAATYGGKVYTANAAHTAFK